MENLSLTIEEVETNLRLLCDIKQYEKLIINGNFLKIDDRYFGSIRRWLSQDNRNELLTFLVNLISEAKRHYNQLIIDIKNGSNPKENYNKLANFFYLIENSRDGLTNIAFTYYDDKLLKAKIETIKREINFIVSEFINTGNQYYN